MSCPLLFCRAGDATVQHSVPTLLSSPKWTVNHPQNGRISIANPLASYTVAAGVNGPGSGNRYPLMISKGQTTSRWPSPKDTTPKTHNSVGMLSMGTCLLTHSRELWCALPLRTSKHTSAVLMT